MRLSAAATKSIVGNPSRKAAAPRIQMKARNGPVDDPLEREADNIAVAVVSGRPIGAIGAASSGSAQRKCAACEAEDEKTLRRKCASCAAEERIQAKSAEAAANVVSHGGEPLSPEQRAYFEPRFGRDLSDVRVHTHGRAADASRTINARAFTLGPDIAFAAGEYRPDTNTGRRLLAHELAHVAQQSGGGLPSVQRQPKDSPWSDWWPPDFKPEFPESPIKPPSTKDAAEGICKLDPSNWICKFYHIEPPPSSKTICPPGFHGSTSSKYKDQCCKDGERETVDNCCPNNRVGDGRCCAAGEVADGGHCKKGADIPPGKHCIPPGRKSPSGDCCIPPKVPGDFGCVETKSEWPPKSEEPPKPLVFDKFVDRFTVLFNQAQPRAGQSFEGSLSKGRGELDQAIAALKKDFSTGAQLVANASKEGEAEKNLDLTDRRLAAVRAEMKDVSWTVRDPMPPMGDMGGCRGSWGAYSCGVKNADQETMRAEDRNVIIRLFRPTEFKLPERWPDPWSPKPWKLPTEPAPF